MYFKNIFLRATRSSKKILEAIEQKLSPNINSKESELLFEDLAPIDDANESEIYLNALNWALKNEKVTNIALTGPYGSGKSSIIKTFEKKYRETYCCLNISLATFKDTELATEALTDRPKAQTQDNNAATTEENHRLIELSILQQMFYHETEEKIPNSRFKRISKIPKKVLVSKTVIVTLWLWGIALLLPSKVILQFSWWPAFYQAHTNWIISSALLFILPGTFYVLQLIIKQFNRLSFSKFNLKSGEIEFNPKSETSILNKHLDEILYFFQATKYNVVVIEDLDRFNDPEIFTKLRELNYLINNSLQVNRRIVFLYAIKDDMFKDESRTKFFDFIIPVIPVINSNNSFEKMSKKLNSLDSKIKFNSDFINDITLYIDDMRALKNILNEYLIYKHLLKKIPIIHEKLLAIIIYKNIHPKDFAALHHNKGILYNVFASKQKIVSKLITDSEKQLETSEQSLLLAKNSSITKVRELRAVYLENFVSRFPGFQSFSMSSDPVSLEAAKMDANFEELSELKNIYYNIYNFSHGQVRRVPSQISFKEVENAVNADQTYVERELIVKNANKNGIAQISDQISTITKSINEIRLMTMKELFEFEPNIINDFDSVFSEDKLLLYLIREGWIDEAYSTLTSHFYEGSISLHDMHFIMSVKNRETLPFDRIIEGPDRIMSRLKSEDFRRDAVLNYALVDHLIANQSLDQSIKLDLILEQIISDATNARKFFIGYLTAGKHAHLFISYFAKKWPQLWDAFESDSDLANSSKVNLTAMLFKHTDLSTLRLQNASKRLQKYVVKQSDFLEWFTSDEEEKIEELLKGLNFQFENLNVNSFPSDLFDFIYLNNKYAINSHMIAEIFRVKGQGDSIAKLSTQNYTTINASPFNELKEFVEANIEDYISDVLLRSPNNTLESEASLIKLINHEEAQEYILDIVKCQQVVIKDLRSVRSEIWSTVLQGKKVEATWDNVLNYYNVRKNIDETLVEYINVIEHFEKLAKYRFNQSKNFDESFYSEFSKNFLVSAISDEAFVKLISNYPYYYQNPTGRSFENLSVVKIEAMISYKKLRLNVITLTFLRDNFSELVTSLIETNLEEFFKDRDSYELDNEDYVVLLKSNNLSPKQKIILIKELTSDIIENTHGLGSVVSSLLVGYQFKELKYGILQSILSTSQLKTENVYLAAWHLNALTKTEISAVLTRLGMPFTKITESKKRPTIPDTKVNRLLGDELQKAHYIYQYKPEKDELRFWNK
jgi:hypothetical protein